MRKVEFALLSAFLAVAALTPAAWAENCYSFQPATLRTEAAQSKMILFGYFDNARVNPNGDGGTTDFYINGVFKNHATVSGKKKIQIPNYVPYRDPDEPPQMILFGDVFNGKPEFYRGVNATPAMAGYVKGLLAIDIKDRAKLLRYCFDHVEHKDEEIARDAFNELSRATPAELAQLGKTLAPNRLRALVQSEKTPATRLSTYGLLLGHCGTVKDAALLRAAHERLTGKGDNTASDGLLIGQVLLQPREGWAYLHKVTANRNAVFVTRYAGFRAARFFYEERSDVVPRPKVVELYADLLPHDDMADLAIEDLRRWQEWALTDHILPLWHHKSHQHNITRRAIARYALQCPHPQCAKFIAALRQTDPSLVADTEESLRLEADLAAPMKQMP